MDQLKNAEAADAKDRIQMEAVSLSFKLNEVRHADHLYPTPSDRPLNIPVARKLYIKRRKLKYTTHTKNNEISDAEGLWSV